MKLVRMPAAVVVGALAMMTLSGAATSAAGAAGAQHSSAARVPAGAAIKRDALIIGSGDAEALRYSLPHVTARDVTRSFWSARHHSSVERSFDNVRHAGGVGPEVRNEKRWSPGMRSESGQGRVGSLGRRPFDLQSIPVTILGQRAILSRFTFNRRRVSVMLSTRF